MHRKPLSVSGLSLKAKLAAGEISQVGLAEYLRCDQTTISKWFSNGATPTLAMAVRIEERWPDVTARGWLEIANELGRYKPREPKGGLVRGKFAKTGSGRGDP
jgi:plasmid maintenance system antidote protein VapI